MKNLNLFFSKINHFDLKEFSDYLFKEIGVSEQIERERSHYVDGHYFTGKFGNFTFKIAHSDENYEKLDYRISINENNHPSEYTMEEKIKEKFLPAGYRLAKFLDFGKNTEKRIDYT